MYPPRVFSFSLGTKPCCGRCCFHVATTAGGIPAGSRTTSTLLVPASVTLARALADTLAARAEIETLKQRLRLSTEAHEEEQRRKEKKRRRKKKKAEEKAKAEEAADDASESEGA